MYDESTQLEDMRAVTANEAAWELMRLSRCGMSHDVETQFVHNPDEETISFKMGDEDLAIRRVQMAKVMSHLKAWFKLNANPGPHQALAQSLTFADIPKYFNYIDGKFVHRKNDYSLHILGRIKSVHPRFLSQFAIRLLALNRTGIISFEDLRTVDGVVHDTFVDAAKVS